MTCDNSARRIKNARKLRYRFAREREGWQVTTTKSNAFDEKSDLVIETVIVVHTWSQPRFEDVSTASDWGVISFAADLMRGTRLNLDDVDKGLIIDCGLHSKSNFSSSSFGMKSDSQ